MRICQKYGFNHIVQLFLMGLLFEPASVFAGYYISIATNEETGAFHFDTHDLPETADKEAIRKCGKFAKAKNKAFKWKYSGNELACSVAVQIKGKRCVALANDDDVFGWGVTYGKRIQDRTRRDALRACRKEGGRDCKIVLELCGK